MVRVSLFASILLWCPALPAAGPLPVDEVPEPLESWVPWVLHGHEQRTCPFLNGDPNQRRCAWPTRLSLDLNKRGGSFDLGVTLYAESWVPLPGGPKLWPQNVSIKGSARTVTLRQGRPAQP